MQVKQTSQFFTREFMNVTFFLLMRHFSVYGDAEYGFHLPPESMAYGRMLHEIKDNIKIHIIEIFR